MDDTDKPHSLLQRPESAEAEVSDFSFTKPASHGRPFSLKNIAKQAPASEAPTDNAVPAAGPLEKEPLVNQCSRADTPLGSRGMVVRQPSIGSTAARQWLQSERDNQSDKRSEGGSSLAQQSRPEREHEVLPIRQTSRVPLRPVNDKPRGQRTQQSTERQSRDAPTENQNLKPSVKMNAQLSENDLFEQLILKVKQREESEYNSTNLRRQIEKENEALKEANRTMQERFKKSQLQLVKATSENRSHRVQSDQWKAKLNTYKAILNELGREYDKVREQTIAIKQTSVSLNQERANIQANLEDIKMELSKYVTTVESQREKLAASGETIAVLREALDNSEKRSELINAQLLNEKKRVVTLEGYIQNESQSQARYLTIVRQEQIKMTDKVDSMCDHFSRACLQTQDAILSNLKPEIERCVTLVEEQSRENSTRLMSTEKFSSCVQDAVSRFDVLADQFTTKIDNSNELSHNVIHKLQEKMQLIEANFGPYSPLVKQLSGNETSSISLQQRIQIVEPMLGDLGASVRSVEATETNLVQGLQNFGHMLSEARIPVGNPVLEKELAEKLDKNTELQLKLQQVSIEAESLQKQVSSKTSELQLLQKSLTQTAATEREHKDHVARLEVEKTALRGELVLLEQRLREEVATANRDSQDEMRAKHEERVKGLEVTLRDEKKQIMQDFDQAKQKTAELQTALAMKTYEVAIKTSAVQEAEEKLKSLGAEVAKSDEALRAMMENVLVMKSRSDALESTGEQANAEIVSLLRRAQEAESWQVTIREGFSKVMEARPDEPFEETWEKIETILQCSAIQTATHDAFCMGSQTPGNAEAMEGRYDDLADEPSFTLFQTKESAQDNEHMPPAPNPSRVQIVPFSSINDRTPKGHSPSPFHEAAEIEMLMMSTPDLGPQGSKQAVPDDAHAAQANAKRKVVSFEGGRRVSDATDNSSGRESEGRETKRNQKRTYSRLRQSVAQDEESDSVKHDADVPTIKNSLSENPEGADEAPQPSKRSRKSGDLIERRPSPKGLASGSSKNIPANQAADPRGRAKRRTRTDRYKQRFSQDADEALP